MPTEILMPALSPTMKEGNLAKWLKKEGDEIIAGEVIAEIETDKATMEVEAVDEGVLGKIIIPEGTENVAVNSCIAIILNEGEDKKALEGYKISSDNDNNKSSNEEELSKNKAKNLESTQDQASKDKAPEKDNFVPQWHKSDENNDKLSSNNANLALNKFSDKIKASPLAKRIAKEEGVSLYQLQGSGPKGRVVKDDVIGFLQSGGAAKGVVRRNPQEFYEVKNNNVRKVIAKRLLDSKQNVPHFYLSCEFDITKLNELRATINSAAPVNQDGKPEYKVSINDLIIKAVALSLKKVPQANSSWSDEAVIIYNNIDVSVAVAIDGGLITPIVKNADQKSIQDISKEMKQLAKKAREGKLQPEEFQGGSFSISNLGMFGIDNFSAIVNPPQSCILAVSRAVEKPVIRDGDIAIASMMNVTLSSDHRSVDGAVGAQFLSALRSFIENPILMLI